MSFFESANVKVFPTAYRQYTTKNTNGNNITTVTQIESRLNTEYNITNLVNGLLDNTINNGNFVIDASVSGNSRILKFCMKGYYFEVTNVPTTITNLWVKIETSSFDYGQELVPINYSSGAQRDLDEKVEDVINFKGLNYVQSEPNDSEYLRILENGQIPEKSKLRFSTNQIGYLDGTSWVSLGTKFKTNTLEANVSFKSPNILVDTSNSFQVKGINNNSQKNQAVYVNNDGKIVSGSHASTKTIDAGTFNVMSSVTMNSDGSLSSVGTKTIPTDTSSFTNDNAHLPTSALVKTVTDRLQTNINNEATTRSSADAALGGRIDSEASDRSSADAGLSSRIDANTTSISERVKKTELTWSYANGVLSITKSY